MLLRDWLMSLGINDTAAELAATDWLFTKQSVQNTVSSPAGGLLGWEFSTSEDQGTSSRVYRLTNLIPDPLLNENWPI